LVGIEKEERKEKKRERKGERKGEKRKGRRRAKSKFRKKNPNYKRKKSIHRFTILKFFEMKLRPDLENPKSAIKKRGVGWGGVR
jgi:hypothetical protein